MTTPKLASAGSERSVSNNVKFVVSGSLLTAALGAVFGQQMVDRTHKERRKKLKEDFDKSQDNVLTGSTELPAPVAPTDRPLVA